MFDIHVSRGRYSGLWFKCEHCVLVTGLKHAQMTKNLLRNSGQEREF